MTEYRLNWAESRNRFRERVAEEGRQEEFQRLWDRYVREGMHPYGILKLVQRDMPPLDPKWMPGWAKAVQQRRPLSYRKAHVIGREQRSEAIRAFGADREGEA